MRVKSRMVLGTIFGAPVRFLGEPVSYQRRVGPMGDAAGTRPSLLIRIRDPGDAEAWGQFVALYGPLIYQFARKQGLQDADAADLTQIVLQAVIDAMKRLDYDPERGSFRGWLYKVVRNQ